MSCGCLSSERCVSFVESEEEFCRGFTFISQRLELNLYQCRNCGTHWQIDTDGRSDLAIKVEHPDHWATFNDLPFRRDFFIRFHGGEGQTKCLWANCPNFTLMNMAICVDHAYPEFSPGSE